MELRDEKEIPFAEMTIPPGFDAGFEHGGKEVVGNKIIGTPDDDGMNGYIWKIGNTSFVNWNDWVISFHIMTGVNEHEKVKPKQNANKRNRNGFKIFSEEPFSINKVRGEKTIYFSNLKEGTTKYVVHLVGKSLCHVYEFSISLEQSTGPTCLAYAEIKSKSAQWMSIIETLKDYDDCLKIEK